MYEWWCGSLQYSRLQLCSARAVTALCSRVGKGEALATASHSSAHSPSGHPFSHPAMQGLSHTSSSGSPLVCSADLASRNGCGFTWQELPMATCPVWWEGITSAGQESPLLIQALARWVTVQKINGELRRRQQNFQKM